MFFLSSIFGSKKYKNINNDELQQIIKSNKNVLILDVRSLEEFRSGHIPKSKNIPVQELSANVNTLDKYKNEDVIVYCASGRRSTSASNILVNNGFSKVYNLGGIGNYKGKFK